MVWTDIKGYSSFGTFTGNGDSDIQSSFVYTGFRPRYVCIKRYDSGSCNWAIWDTYKNTGNLSDWFLYSDDGGSNQGYVLGAGYTIDILSNGFKLKTTSACYNASNDDMKYIAFAEFPIVSSNDVPGVAR